MGVSDVHMRGGRGDQGIDIIGKWRLGERDMDVVVQCKRIHRKGPPILVRELEGSILGSGLDVAGTVGVIASTMPPTDACRERLRSSGLPLLYLRVDTDIIQELYFSSRFMSTFPAFSVAPNRATTKPCLGIYYDGRRLGVLDE